MIYGYLSSLQDNYHESSPSFSYIPGSVPFSDGRTFRSFLTFYVSLPPGVLLIRSAGRRHFDEKTL